MSNEAQITLTGTAGGDAELRFLPNGTAVANVSVAVTPREKRGDEWVDGETAWYRIAAWRDMAENVAESVRRGDRVTVVGRLKPRTWEKDGKSSISLDVDADSVALDLRFRGARSMEKANRGQSQPQQGGDPWATNGNGGGGWADQEKPF